PSIVDGAGIMLQLSSHLPPLAGDRTQLATLAHQLLHYAQTYLLTVGRLHRILVITRAVGSTSISAEAPALFALAPPTEVEIELLESDMVWSAEFTAPSSPSSDLLESYQLVRELGGILDVSAPMQGPLRIILRLPAASRPPVEKFPLPDTAAASSPPRAPDTTQGTAAPAPTTPGRPQQERRHSARTTTALPATITIGSTTWDGTITHGMAPLRI
ncbi:MAG: hypothetical protein K8R65_07300, partial [Nitrospirae bacterium]|nr:hypothetical protein [Nitrospirota bacterium]